MITYPLQMDIKTKLIAARQMAGTRLYRLLMDQLTADHAVIAFVCLTFTARLARAGNA